MDKAEEKGIKSAEFFSGPPHMSVSLPMYHCSQLQNELRCKTKIAFLLCLETLCYSAV